MSIVFSTTDKQNKNYGSSMITAVEQEKSNARNRVACTILNLVISNSLKHFPRSQTNIVQQ